MYNDFACYCCCQRRRQAHIHQSLYSCVYWTSQNRHHSVIKPANLWPRRDYKQLEWPVPSKLQSKYPVLYKGAFGGTGFLFLGRLGSRASTEQKIGPIMSNFWGQFLYVFMGKFENIAASALKSCILSLFWKSFFDFFLIFWGAKKFSNLSVLHKGLPMQDWVFRLGSKLISSWGEYQRMVYNLIIVLFWKQ